MTSSPGGGIVAVHAHPDDESITMGGTLARYAAAGIPVTLVTATLGEHGELMDGRHGGLAADAADQLGGYRYAELAAACAALHIDDRRLLGGLGAFRDSGMAGEPSAAHPRAFLAAQRGGPRHEEAVAALVKVLRDVDPRVVLTYDETGGYGHPDHIAAHQVTLAAVERCHTTQPDPDRWIRLLAVVRPRDVLAAALADLWARPLPPGYLRPHVDALGTLVTDPAVPTLAVDVTPWRAARRAAMASHATQLDVWAGRIDGFALTNMYAQPLLDAEYFQHLAGPVPPAGATDLFAGL